MSIPRSAFRDEIAVIERSLPEGALRSQGRKSPDRCILRDQVEVERSPEHTKFQVVDVFGDDLFGKCSSRDTNHMAQKRVTQRGGYVTKLVELADVCDDVSVRTWADIDDRLNVDPDDRICPVKEGVRHR